MISMMLLVILVGETTNENMIQVATICMGSNVILCTNETKQYSPSEYVNGHSIAGYVAGRASEPGIFTISCHCQQETQADSKKHTFDPFLYQLLVRQPRLFTAAFDYCYTQSDNKSR